MSDDVEGSLVHKLYRKNIELAFLRLPTTQHAQRKESVQAVHNTLELIMKKTVFSIPELKEYQELISEQIQKKPDIIIVSII